MSGMVRTKIYTVWYSTAIDNTFSKQTLPTHLQLLLFVLAVVVIDREYEIDDQ